MVTLAMVFVCLRWQQVKRVIAQGLGLDLGLGLMREGGLHPGEGLEEGLGPERVDERRGDVEVGNGSGLELASAQGSGLGSGLTQGCGQGLGLGLAQGQGLGKEGTTLAFVGNRTKEGRMLLPSDEIEEEDG